MARRLILFDIDGTLIDTAGAGKLALHRAFARTFELGDLDDIAARTATVRFSGMTDPTIVAALAGALDCSDRLGARSDLLESRYLEELQVVLEDRFDRCRLIPGIDALLATLNADPSVDLGLVTGNIEAGARIKLEPFGLNRFFPTGGFGSDHADRRQVARAAVERASHQADRPFTADQVTVVGDTEHDVDCARANGYRAVAVATGWVPSSVLETAEPDAILETIDASPETLQSLWGDGYSDAS